MPKATRSRLSGIVLRPPWIALTSDVAESSPKPSRAARSLHAQREEVGHVADEPSSRSCATRCSPSPSISSAPREAKWTICASSWAGHGRIDAVGVALVADAHQLTAARRAGRRELPRAACGDDPPRRTAPTTSGMTSPALRTITRSPGRTSFAFTWSSLCSVAIDTVDPATTTGSSTAKGVTRPVRPTDTSMSSSRVVRSSGGSLRAMAHRGARLVKPSRGALREVVDLDDDAVDLVGAVRGGGPRTSRCARSSRVAPTSVVVSGAVRNPQVASVRERLDVAGEGREPRRARPAGTRGTTAGDCAVTDGSFWRRLPAAALRGLANSFSSGSRWRRFISAKSALGEEDLAAHLDAPAGAARAGVWGTLAIVRTFSVTSSPTRPSPRVAACVSDAVDVGDGQRQAVDLGFDDEDDLLARRRALRATRSLHARSSSDGQRRCRD